MKLFILFPEDIEVICGGLNVITDCIREEQKIICEGSDEPIQLSEENRARLGIARMTPREVHAYREYSGNKNAEDLGRLERYLAEVASLTNWLRQHGSDLQPEGQPSHKNHERTVELLRKALLVHTELMLLRSSVHIPVSDLFKKMRRLHAALYAYTIAPDGVWLASEIFGEGNLT